MLTTLLDNAPNTVLGNIIVVSGAFIILLILVRKFAWGAITGIFEERANKINNDITTAELSKKEAETLLAQRENELAGSKEEAANIIQTANDTAKQNRANILNKNAKKRSVQLKGMLLIFQYKLLKNSSVNLWIHKHNQNLLTAILLSLANRGLVENDNSQFSKIQ